MRVREDRYVPGERAPAARGKSLTPVGTKPPKGREAFSAGAGWLVRPGDSLSEDEPLLAHFVTARLGLPVSFFVLLHTSPAALTSGRSFSFSLARFRSAL